MNAPIKISIVTVVFNGEAELEQTILSVLHQTYSYIEYVIIDGGSTDNTIAIMEKYKDRIDVFLSESDKGIYDAMNKGISLLTGDWCHFLNVGDTFYDKTTIQEVVKKLESRFLLCYGEYVLVLPNGRKELDKQKNLISPWKTYKVINHQSIFYNVIKLEQNEFKYDLGYRVLADYHLTLKIIDKYGIDNIKKISIPIANYSFGGMSHENKETVLKERKLLLKKYVKNNTLLHWNILILNLKLWKTLLIKKIFSKTELRDVLWEYPIDGGKK